MRFWRSAASVKLTVPIEASVRKAMNDEVRETFQGIFADTGLRFV
ncbi:hypothetical protein [Maritimibacter fusiformis]|nr:hypothetical protein [Maritimibacter fusiformis]